MADPIQLVPSKPDAELAAEFKVKIIETIQPTLELLEQINKAGFQANLSFGMDPLNKMRLTQLQIVKVF